MTAFEKQEFWKALTRLYDTTLEHSKQIEQLASSARQDGENIRALVRIAELHNQRITRIEKPGEPQA